MQDVLTQFLLPFYFAGDYTSLATLEYKMLSSQRPEWLRRCAGIMPQLSDILIPVSIYFVVSSQKCRLFRNY